MITLKLNNNKLQKVLSSSYTVDHILSIGKAIREWTDQYYREGDAL
jgi:hypothetical protein